MTSIIAFHLLPGDRVSGAPTHPAVKKPGVCTPGFNYLPVRPPIVGPPQLPNGEADRPFQVVYRTRSARPSRRRPDKPLP